MGGRSELNSCVCVCARSSGIPCHVRVHVARVRAEIRVDDERDVLHSTTGLTATGRPEHDDQPPRDPSPPAMPLLWVLGRAAGPRGPGMPSKCSREPRRVVRLALTRLVRHFIAVSRSRARDRGRWLSSSAAVLNVHFAAHAAQNLRRRTPNLRRDMPCNAWLTIGDAVTLAIFSDPACPAAAGCLRTPSWYT